MTTVNSNIGTFNNVTVNGKGLVTAASNVTYLTSYTETDPIVKAINGIVKSNGTTISAAVPGTDYEAALGNPTTNGYVLSSTTAGVRSWIANGSGGRLIRHNRSQPDCLRN